MLLQTEQRTQEWLDARKGKITASLAAACLGMDPHTGPLSAFNQITGRTKQAVNKHMAWGMEFEGRARNAYECEAGVLVTETGFYVHDTLPWLGASPDGLIGDDGLCEIKCPSNIPATVPEHHAIQMRVQLAVTGRAWCDYFAWNQNAHLLVRVERDQLKEDLILSGLQQFYQTHIVPDVAPARKRRGQ